MAINSIPGAFNSYGSYRAADRTVNRPASKISVSEDSLFEPISKKVSGALGQYVSALSTMEKPNNANIYTMDEARIGLDFSILAMKADTLRSSGGISETIAGLLQKTADEFMKSFLDRLDGQLSASRKAGAAAGDRAGFAALDRNMVWNVYNQTMQH